jgi:uncharacterized protein YkwD
MAKKMNMFMRRFLLGIILSLGLFMAMAGPVGRGRLVSAETGAWAPKERSERAASVSAEILRYVNEYRHSKGLKPLQANSYISSVALDHSRDMLSGKTPFGHEGFRDRIDRIKKRLGPIHVAAENVASGPMGAREVVDGWLHSPGHRRNIEGDFRLTGIGLAYGRRGMIYFTQIFTR